MKAGRSTAALMLSAATSSWLTASSKEPQCLLLGTPGSGKSFTAKREMIAVYLLTNDDIIVCDPKPNIGLG